jgi:hypothetical protein
MHKINNEVLDSFLKSHPNMGWKEFKDACPEKCSIWTFYDHRRKLGLVKVSIKPRKSVPQTTTFQPGSKIAQLYNLLQQNPDGISNEDASKALNIELKTLSNLFYRLKHEFKCKITRIGHIHKMKSNTSIVPVSSTVSPVSVPIISQLKQGVGIIGDFKSMGFDFKIVMAELEGLSPQKKLNYIDQLERSIFFRLSAQAIKSADRLSLQLTSIISS